MREGCEDGGSVVWCGMRGLKKPCGTGMRKESGAQSSIIDIGRRNRDGFLIWFLRYIPRNYSFARSDFRFLEPSVRLLVADCHFVGGGWNNFGSRWLAAGHIFVRKRIPTSSRINGFLSWPGTGKPAVCGKTALVLACGRCGRLLYGRRIHRRYGSAEPGGGCPSLGQYLHPLSVGKLIAIVPNL